MGGSSGYGQCLGRGTAPRVHQAWVTPRPRAWSIGWHPSSFSGVLARVCHAKLPEHAQRSHLRVFAPIAASAGSILIPPPHWQQPQLSQEAFSDSPCPTTQGVDGPDLWFSRTGAQAPHLQCFGSLIWVPHFHEQRAPQFSCLAHGRFLVCLLKDWMSGQMRERVSDMMKGSSRYLPTPSTQGKKKTCRQAGLPQAGRRKCWNIGLIPTILFAGPTRWIRAQKTYSVVNKGVCVCVLVN